MAYERVIASAFDRRVFLQGSGAVGGVALMAGLFGGKAFAQGGGVFRIAMTSLEGEVLDPIQGHPNKVLKLPLFDYIVGVNAEGTALSKDSGLAEDWSVSDDGLTWTFKIRQGVPFHKDNGTVTAADAAYSIARILGTDANTGAVPYFRNTIDGIEAPDAATLVVRLKQRAVDLAFMLSPMRQSEGQIVCESYIQRVGEDEFRRNPIGSGPFEFVERVSGSKVTFKALSHHWNWGDANYEAFEAIQVPEESTRLTMLRRGEVDVIDIPRRLYESVNGEEGLNVAARVGDTTYTVWFTGLDKDGPLHDERVRRALSHAIDRSQIVQLFGGSELARVAQRIGSCGNWNDFCLPSNPLEFDLERAGTLLREAGHAGLEITINTSGIYPEQQIVSEALAGFWGAIGVNAVVEQIDFGSWRQGFGTKTLKPNSVFVNQQPNSTLSASSLGTFYGSQSAVKMISTPEIEEYVIAAQTALDLDAQNEAAGMAAKLVFEQTFEIPLVESGQVLAFGPHVVNTHLGGRQYVDFGVREMLTQSGRG